MWHISTTITPPVIFIIKVSQNIFLKIKLYIKKKKKKTTNHIQNLKKLKLQYIKNQLVF